MPKSFTLKKLDAFKQPVKLFLSRKDRKTKKTIKFEKLGSIYGFYLTVMGVIFCFMFLTHLTMDMLNGEKDTMDSHQVMNNFEMGYNEAHMGEIDFLPSY